MEYKGKSSIMGINIAVIGGSVCSKKFYKIARDTGRLIAQQGWTLVCGGGFGVMEAACKGAKEKGGFTVGILPGYDCREANDFLDVNIPTGLGCARNVLVVRSSEAIIAIDGQYGTLSEIAFAFNEGKPIVGIDSWQIKGLIMVDSAEEAVKKTKYFLERKK
ncbi:MAG: TIGR00725 family protein [Candidatus Omnitrophica bacterium]|nr:TIGR00725 family protein [Candidatus Omnitrophota bacterium]MBD3269063.1 TIGR00725 family protein [Candidatus Omnitrophota bacterium]